MKWWQQDMGQKQLSTWKKKSKQKTLSAISEEGLNIFYKKLSTFQQYQSLHKFYFERPSKFTKKLQLLEYDVCDAQDFEIHNFSFANNLHVSKKFVKNEILSSFLSLFQNHLQEKDKGKEW